MRDVVVANGDNICLASKLNDLHTQDNIKDALASYYITKPNTSFARYEYTEGDVRSIPMVSQW